MDLGKAEVETYCWGSNQFGQMGFENKNYEQFVAKPKFIRYRSKIVQIACGFEHSLFLTSAGELYSMGSNGYGQLGLGSKIKSRSSPTLLGEGACREPVDSVACGAYHCLAITSHGTKLYSWGRNDLGQLGREGGEVSHSPADVTAGLALGKRTILQVAGGKTHSGALLSGGQAYTWGGNEFGQLAVDYKARHVAAPHHVAELDRRAVAISCGYSQTLFLLEDGSLMACGSNNKGQLGVDEDTAIVDLPTEVKGIEGEIRSIHTSNFCAAVTRDNCLYIWGLTHIGVLTAPERMACLAEQVAEVGLGEDLICALDKNNFVYSWGRNERGQLGLGDTTDQTSVCLIESLNDRDVALLAVGRNFIIGLGEGGGREKTSGPLSNAGQEDCDQGASPDDEQAFSGNTVGQGSSRQSPGQPLAYGLHSSILDVYKHVSPTEAVYSIKEVDALKQENQALKLVAGTYELMRQQFVAILESLAQKNSRAIESLDPRRIQKVVLEENFIEKQLSVISFDLNALIASEDLEAQLQSHQFNPELHPFRLPNPIQAKPAPTEPRKRTEETCRSEDYAEGELSYRPARRNEARNAEKESEGTKSKRHYESTSYSDPELYYLYSRLRQNKSIIENRIQDLSHNFDSK